MADYPAYVPTLEEIAAACLRIQATWSAAEKERRRVNKGEGYCPAAVHEAKLSDIYGAYSGWIDDASAIRDYAPKCERTRRQ